MIQFSINTLFSSIWPIDRPLAGATTPGKSGPGSDGNKGVLRIPQNSRITRASPWDFLVSYSEHSLEQSNLSPEMQLVRSLAPVNWGLL